MTEEPDSTGWFTWRNRAVVISIASVILVLVDGIVATGCDIARAEAAEARQNEEVATLRGHESTVLSVAFSPDGTRVASGSYDETIKLWDAASGEEVATLRGHKGIVYSVAFSPDGTRVASGSWDNTIKLWDTASGEEVAPLRGHGIGILRGVMSVAYSPDGTRVASGSGDETIKLWDGSPR